MKGFLQRILQEIMKKIILGTSDAWSTICLSHRPSDPAYYIVNWRISYRGLWEDCLMFLEDIWKIIKGSLEDLWRIMGGSWEDRGRIVKDFLETRYFMNLVNGSIIFKPVWKFGNAASNWHVQDDNYQKFWEIGGRVWNEVSLKYEMVSASFLLQSINHQL